MERREGEGRGRDKHVGVSSLWLLQTIDFLFTKDLG